MMGSDASAMPQRPVLQGRWQLCLLGGFRLSRDGDPVVLPRGVQRPVAFVALVGERDRAYVAGQLWPECSDAHALSRLRSALWRLNATCPGLILTDGGRLTRGSGLAVDMDELTECVAALIGGREVSLSVAHDLLDGPEVLPGWYDDWVVLVQERIRQ